MNFSKIFGERFWRKISETFNIYKFHEQPPKKFEKLYELDEEEMNININSALEWSKNNKTFYNDIKTNGYSKSICNKQYVYNLYTEINFNEMELEELDPELLKFRSLSILKLNGNNIQKIDYLPDHLTQLFLYQNKIFDINRKNQVDTLLYLGLAYNKVNDDFVECISYCFPNLKSLDLSYNQLCKIEQTIENLVPLKQLRILCMKGNPICLIKGYAKGVISELKVLKYLDETEIPQKQEDLQASQVYQSPQAKAKLRQSVSSVSQNLGNQSPIFISQQAKTVQFMVEVLNLDNLQGINLENIYQSDVELTPQQSQSQYWVSLSLMDREIKQDKIIMFDSATVENEKARINLDFTYNEVLPIVPELQDFMRNGIIVKIFCKQPIMLLDEETQEKKPVIKETLPQMEETILGICYINLIDWLENTIEDNKLIEKQYQLFPATSLTVPELYYPRDNEGESIKKYQKPQTPQTAAKQDDHKNVKKDNKGLPLKKGGKDLKKFDKKLGKKGGKGNEEPEKKIVQLLNWPFNPREKIFVNEKEIIENVNLQLAVRVSLNKQIE